MGDGDPKNGKAEASINSCQMHQQAPTPTTAEISSKNSLADKKTKQVEDNFVSSPSPTSGGGSSTSTSTEKKGPCTSSGEGVSQALVMGSPRPVKKSPNDFVFGKLLGEGSFSSVYLAKDVKTAKEYASKIIST